MIRTGGHIGKPRLWRPVVVLIATLAAALVLALTPAPSSDAPAATPHSVALAATSGHGGVHGPGAHHPGSASGCHGGSCSSAALAVQLRELLPPSPRTPHPARTAAHAASRSVVPDLKPPIG